MQVLDHDAPSRAAGVAVVGGHTVRDPELKFGLSVTGEVALDAVWANTGARAGQVLVLTKPLGTGIIGQAIKAEAASAAEIAAAIASMTTLNDVAARVEVRLIRGGARPVYAIFDLRA